MSLYMPSIPEGRQKVWLSQSIWDWLLSLSAAFTAVRAYFATRSVVINKRKQRYHIGSTEPAHDKGAENGALDLLDVREKLKLSGQSNSRIIVRLGDDDVLCHDRVFPKAVADVIEPVLRNQIPKLVPWTEDDHTFAYKILGNGISNDDIKTQIIVTRQSLIDEIRAQARAAGLTLDAIQYTGEGAAQTPIEFYSSADAGRELTAKRLGRFIAGTCLLSLALTAVGYTKLAVHQWNLFQVEQSISSQRQQLQQALLERQSNSRNSEQIDELISKKRDSRPRIALINQLSRLLPDQTWLDRLEIRNNLITISGFSDNAAALVGILEGSDAFYDVKFTAATERGRVDNREKFQISTRLNPGRGEEKQ